MVSVTAKHYEKTRRERRGEGEAYQAWIYAKSEVFLALFAFGRDCVGEDGDTAAGMVVSV